MNRKARHFKRRMLPPQNHISRNSVGEWWKDFGLRECSLRSARNVDDVLMRWPDCRHNWPCLQVKRMSSSFSAVWMPCSSSLSLSRTSPLAMSS